MTAPRFICARSPFATDEGHAVLARIEEALLARQRVVHLRPARPRRIRTVGKAWAWGALGLPCRLPDDDGARCGACPPCEARAEALRVWCP